jgi:hypothetical protein
MAGERVGAEVVPRAASPRLELADSRRSKVLEKRGGGLHHVAHRP